jgi:hypothetical protein
MYKPVRPSAKSELTRRSHLETFVLATTTATPTEGHQRGDYNRQQPAAPPAGCLVILGAAMSRLCGLAQASCCGQNFGGSIAGSRTP